jgi:hypothetical protein
MSMLQLMIVLTSHNGQSGNYNVSEICVPFNLTLVLTYTYLLIMSGTPLAAINGRPQRQLPNLEFREQCFSNTFNGTRAPNRFS